MNLPVADSLWARAAEQIKLDRGVVDWDDAGTGSRATDLASLLFEWHRMRLGGKQAAPGGDEKITSRITAIAGDHGLRCVIAYVAIDWIGGAAQHGDTAGTQTYRQITSAVLDTLTRGTRTGPAGISTDSARGPETTGNNRHVSDNADTRTGRPTLERTGPSPGYTVGISAGHAT